MHKKTYITPLLQTDSVLTRCYICGDNSIPGGGEGGPGIAEGKERKDDENPDNGWGSLW